MRATPATVAPQAASLTAIARPMPRDAPVTSATCPVKSTRQPAEVALGPSAMIVTSWEIVLVHSTAGLNNRPPLATRVKLAPLQHKSIVRWL